jgi:hypothetical protein
MAAKLICKDLDGLEIYQEEGGKCQLYVNGVATGRVKSWEAITCHFQPTHKWLYFNKPSEPVAPK